MSNPVRQSWPEKRAAQVWWRLIALARGTALRQRLTRGVLWSTIGSGLLQGFTLIASIPLGRILGKAEYGALGVIQGTIATFSIFAGPALGLTANTHVAKLRDRDPRRAARVLSLTGSLGTLVSAGFGIVLLLAARPLATDLLREPALTSALRIGALALFLTGVDSAQRGAIAGFEEFRALAIIALARGVLTLPVMLLLARNYGLQGAVVGLGIIAGVEALINWRVLRTCRKRFHFEAPGRERWLEWRTILVFSLPALLGGALSVPAAWLASAFLTWNVGGYADLGVFNAANNWRNAILFLPVVLNQPFLSVLSHSYGIGAPQRFWRVLSLNVVLTTGSACLAAACVIVLRGTIMRAYGSGFAGGTGVLVYLVLAAVFSAAVSAIGSAISATGRMWDGVALNAVWATMLVAAAWMLRARGAIGLAEAWFIAGLVHLVCVSLYTFFALRRAAGLQFASITPSPTSE